MTRYRSPAYMLLMAVLLFGVMAAMALFAAVSCRPQREPAATVSETPPPPPTATAADRDPTPTFTPTPTATLAATPPPGACGRTGTTTILLLGESMPADRAQRGASALRLLEVDYGAGRVRVLALPPYMAVDTPALYDAGIRSAPLTLVYQEGLARGEGSERARMAQATDLLLRTLNANFGLAPEHSVTIRQGVFVDTIDALGGIEIALPDGEQVLDGGAALAYVARYADGAQDAATDPDPPPEWARLARQTEVLEALRDRLRRPEALLRLPRLARRVHQDVVTDLGLDDVRALACMLQAPDLEVAYLTLPDALFAPGAHKVLYPQTGEIVAALAEMGFVEEGP
jgi:hypothetical protein